MTTLSNTSQQFIDKPKQLFINGRWQAALSERSFPTINPATGEVIAHIAEGDREDVNLAVIAAREALHHRSWAGLTPSERGKIIWRIGDLILKYADELAELESLDNGKPRTVARVADVALAADMFHYMAGWASKLHGLTIPISVPYAPDSQFLSYTTLEPIGVVGQIIPWNFPLLMAAWKLAPALATGCTVVLKPAEETSLTALRLAEILQEAELPNGVVNIITGFGETAGAALAAHPGVDKIAFTGSTEVGKLIVKAAAHDLKKVTLELGGKSPNIILKDANLEQAIAGAASAIFFNHGQTCCAGSRLYVANEVFEQVVEGVAKIASGIRLGSGLDAQTEMGPLVSQSQLDRVHAYLQIGVQEGAEVVCGGQPKSSSGFFFEPTVLTEVSAHMKVVQEEIFGPVVVAMPFSEPDELLLQQANDSIYGLAAGIWTSNISLAHSLAHKLKAGTVWINCYNVFDAALPFGGYKQSGWGREMGYAVLEQYTEKKAVTIKL